MPRAIGFRASSGEVYYALVEGSPAQPSVVDCDRLRLPKAMDLPEALGWLRGAVLAIIGEYQVKACGVRTTEPLAAVKGNRGKGSETRHYLEAVILETAASTGLDRVYGPSATLTARLDAGSSVKGYVQASDFRGVERWDNYTEACREAIVTATAALALLEDAE